MTHVDISLGWMFSQATGVVQGVLAALILCSVACWAVILEKAMLSRRYARQTRRFEALVRRGGTKLEADGRAKGTAGMDGLPGALLSQAKVELAARRTGESAPDRRDRVERAMRETLASELLHAEARLPYLATISSVPPSWGCSERSGA